MNLIAPIDCFTGYGITSYNILYNLYQKNKNITLFPIGNPNLESGWNKEIVQTVFNNQINYDKQQPCLKIWHDNDFFTRPAGSSKYGGLSFFELDNIQDKNKTSYSLLDTIFVPSNWAKMVLENNGITKDIVVCPQGVDTSLFNDDSREDKDDKYIFINIGKWEIRKGHDVLVDIFNESFEKEDNVELWMINHNPFLKQEQANEWIKLYKQSKLSDKIRFFPRIPDQKTLSNIMSYADCGIFPSRGEGWNNEAIEILAKNKPLIITNYSAHTEYCTSENAYLIDIDTTTPAIDNIWFHGQGNWAEIGQDQIDQAIEYMRYVYNNKIRTNPEGLKTAQTYSWQKTADILYTNLYDGVY